MKTGHFNAQGQICAPRPCLAVGLALLGSLQSPLAQGTLTVQNTGSGQVLVSEVRSVFVDANSLQPRLLFDFGFATQEVPTPGVFLDSYTVTIQTPDQLATALYLTADGQGVDLAPPTPGALVINPQSLTLLPITYPTIQPVLPNQQAFEVSAAIPAEFWGEPVNVYFDLFDNQDANASQGESAV
jgi:hypothetical protein